MTKFHFFFLEGDRYKKTRRFCLASLSDAETAKLELKEFTRCSTSKGSVGSEKYLGIGVWSHCTSVAPDSDVTNDSEQTSTVDAEPEGGLLVPFVGQHDDKKQAGAS